MWVNKDTIGTCLDKSCFADVSAKPHLVDGGSGGFSKPARLENTLQYLLRFIRGDRRFFKS